jgi:inorganic pyrophosphatase
VVQKAADIQDAISEGANSFLFTEYKYMGIFMVGCRSQDLNCPMPR